MKQKTLVSAIKRTLGAEILISAAFVTAAYAQTAPATGASAPIAASAASSGNVTQLNKVEITGSLIRSSDKVGFNQVQTVTAAQIQASGATTVADFLRDTSANSASSWGEDNTDSFAPGGAGIALRGLSEKYTLVLVDGVRVANYGFAVNGTDSFFDLNTIPLNMVERIEIVKTGAVSQYGSDAIAGVVNIITKKNVQGLTLDGSLGGATSGGLGTDKLNVTGGFGDLNADRFNVTIGASYFHQDGDTLADRSNTSSQNFTNQPFGVITKGVSYWEPNGVGNGSVPLSPCPSGQTVIDGSVLAGGNTGCTVNTANGTSLEPNEDRASAKIHATFKLTDDIEAYADLWESRNVTTVKDGYAGINDNLFDYNPATGVAQQVSNVVSGSNQYNPYGVATPLTYQFLGEPETLRTTSNFYRAATGIKGSFDTPSVGDWDWSAQVSHSQSTVDNYETGLVNVQGLENILGPNGQFNFSNPASTPNGLAGLYMNDEDEAISMLDTVDLSLSTANLFTLPAGNVGLGVGAQFTHQSQSISDYSGAIQGTELDPGIQTVTGQRNVAAVFYQIDVPVLTGVTFSQSGRYDHYSDFGGAFSPRFALRWQPINALTTYASYSRGFRAPTLIENSQSTTFSYQSAVDPYSPVNSTTPQDITEVTKGNPDLQPERTRNYNVGFELSPNSTTDFGMDWYKIDISGVIGTANITSLVAENDPNVVIRNANGTIDYVNTAYQNLSTLTTDGFEATFRKSLPTSLGTFTLSGDWAYVWHFKMPVGGVETDYAGNNGAIYQPFGASFPRWKGTVDMVWNYRKFSTDLEFQYTGPYTQTVITPGSVASYSQFNLNVSYTGFKNWTLYGGIDNIFNKQPPFDALWQYETTGTPYDVSLYNDNGRFLQVGATYHF